VSYSTEMGSFKPEFQIFFEGTFLDNLSGIGRDSRNLLQAAYLAFGPRVKVIYPQISWNLKFRISERKPSSTQLRIIQLKLLLGFSKFHIPDNSLYIKSHLNGPIPFGKNIKFILRCHDIFPITNPEWFKRLSVTLFRKFFKSLPKDSHLICDSESTFKQVLDARPDLIYLVVAYCPVSIPKSTPCEVCTLCLNEVFIPQKYFLSIGTLEPRKNYGKLLKLWNESLLNQDESRHLLIMGKYGWKLREIRKALRKKAFRNVIWVADSCDFKLFEVLKNSEGLISISLNEGFNLPVAESIVCNVRTLLSNISVHLEMYQPHSIFLEGNYQEDFDNALSLLVASKIDSSNVQKTLPFSQEVAISKLVSIFREFI
jgi:glycosyltransferase involved in cell wall biosynthesis